MGSPSGCRTRFITFGPCHTCPLYQTVVPQCPAALQAFLQRGVGGHRCYFTFYTVSDLLDLRRSTTVIFPSPALVPVVDFVMVPSLLVRWLCGLER